jgi:rRNA maturation RNase YbeY
MIEYNYETNFVLKNEELTSSWIQNCILEEGFTLGEVNYIFCDDAYLLKLNIEFLNHDTFTDIISFDNTLGKLVNGDIFISVDRVKENAKTFNTSFDNELHRVMIHGILHYLGYKDKSEEEKKVMRSKENQHLLSLNS